MSKGTCSSVISMNSCEEERTDGVRAKRTEGATDGAADLMEWTERDLCWTLRIGEGCGDDEREGDLERDCDCTLVSRYLFHSSLAQNIILVNVFIAAMAIASST